MDYSSLSKEELQAQLNELEAKYQKMRSLALKIAKEMDSLAEQYTLVTQEINNRK